MANERKDTRTAYRRIRGWCFLTLWKLLISNFSNMSTMTGTVFITRRYLMTWTPILAYAGLTGRVRLPTTMS